MNLTPQTHDKLLIDSASSTLPLPRPPHNNFSFTEFPVEFCMGQLRFRVPDPESYDARIWGTAFVSGIEGIPWASKNRVEKDCLIIERAVNESGKLSIVWPTEEYGPIMLSTASLRCQEAPYLLHLELARGTIHRIRGRGIDWQRLGLKLPEAFTSLMDRAVSAFVQAILAADDLDRCVLLAQTAIDFAVTASKPLSRAFISQSLHARHQSEKQLSTLLGIKLAPSQAWEQDVEAVLPAINTINISMEMGQLETESKESALAVIDSQLQWARRNSLRIFGGPLLNLQSHAVPKWLYLLSDFPSMYEAACKHATMMVERYRGQVHLWSAAAGLNAPNTLGITDEQVLHLAVGVIQAVRRSDPKTPVVLTIDAPWAEYLGQKPDGISPLHFADALIRADLGLSGLGLELNFNYWQGGSMPRDLVDVSDLIDHWNILGLPLLAHVSAPCHLQTDPMATAKSELVSNWRYPNYPWWDQSQMSDSGSIELPAGAPIAPVLASMNSAQAIRVRMPVNGLEVIQMLLAKSNVHGIFWNQYSDREDHVYPNAGLVAASGKRRSLLDGLSRLRQLHVH
ncbi:MAG: hypothetical protein NTY15_05890 [Planctomycetota bacterium]|nr:hypothetical protein [Planctomycetota bacterium]